MKISKTKRGWLFETRVGDIYIPPDRFLVNDVIWPWEYNPHHVRPWIIYNEFGALGLVWGENLQVALDAAADSEQRLMGPQELSEEDAQERVADEDEPAYLGNAGIPHDLTYVGYVELDARTFPAELVAKIVEALGEGDDTLEGV